ncbi:methyltransferase ustM [Colletotrichum spaethianum]|uniref:Methyltransferase ustM n=1 Tax=Colletotrichum spaethianum TaxID=700344 RepID=A0AA37PGH4_9PEZI|nr:methyltransferase ustM [Colletotrichum spaethianum]GKT51876.1 methyltransferase ustM [Colletotrichum spaethianum]
MSQPPSPPSPTLLSLANSYPHNPAHLHTVLLPQLAHRLRLAALWSIAPSTKVLDIGCGQGDSSLALSHVVGPPTPDGDNTTGAGAASGAPPGPGHADAPAYLASNPSASFDTAALCHSLWYFPSRAAVVALFEALYSSGQVKRLCFAEYALTARTPSQKPHEMAVAAQKRFHALREDRGLTLHQANVRGALDPEEMVALAQEAGWKLVERGVVDTPGLLDGRWEVGAVVDPSWAEEVAEEGLGKKAEEELLGYVAEVKAAVDKLKESGEKVATMDAVWVVMER